MSKWNRGSQNVSTKKNSAVIPSWCSYSNIIQGWPWPVLWLAELEYVQGDTSIFSVTSPSCLPEASTPQAGLLLIMTAENQYQEERKMESARQNPWTCHVALIKVNWSELSCPALKTFRPLLCRVKQLPSCREICIWEYLLFTRAYAWSRVHAPSSTSVPASKECHGPLASERATLQTVEEKTFRRK